MKKKGLSVVILDDEEHIIDLLKLLIPWQDLGLEYAGCARNGIDGKELITSVEPDIVISDIKMPGMDGLSLIKEVHGLLPDTEFIIVSGFSQFDYAKTAITYGVKNYLLKPVNKEELTQTLQKIIQEKTKQQIAKKTEEKKSSMEFYEFLKNGGRDLAESFANMSGQSLCLIKIDSGEDRLSNDLQELLQEKSMDLLKRLFSVSVYCYMYSEFFFVLDSKDEREEDALKKLYTNLKDFTQIFPQLKFTVFGSRIHGSVLEARQTLNVALPMRYDSDRNVFYFEEPLEESNDEPLVQKYTDSWNKRTPQFFTRVDSSFAEGEIAEFVASCAGLEPRVQETVFMRAARRVAILSEEKQVEGLAWYESTFEKTILLASDRETLRQRFTDSVTAFVQEFYSNQKRESIRPIRLANAYMEEHYSDYDISLDSVAESVGLTSSYFSALYKKETGNGFLESLTELRINKAKQLLQDTNYTIAKISEDVGYTDVKYFSKTFKRVTGIKPNEFRQFYS